MIQGYDIRWDDDDGEGAEEKEIRRGVHHVRAYSFGEAVEKWKYDTKNSLDDKGPFMRIAGCEPCEGACGNPPAPFGRPYDMTWRAKYSGNDRPRTTHLVAYDREEALEQFFAMAGDNLPRIEVVALSPCTGTHRDDEDADPGLTWEMR